MSEEVLYVVICILVIVVIAVSAYAFTQPKCSPDKICPTCPLCPAEKNCPTCPELRLGLKINAKTENIKALVDKIQNVLNVGQQSACTVARTMYTEVREKLAKEMKNPILLATPVFTSKCEKLKTDFTKAVNEMYTEFNTQVQKTQQTTTVEVLMTAAKLKPLINDLGVYVISIVCVNDMVSPDKVLQALDEVFNSVCN